MCEDIDGYVRKNNEETQQRNIEDMKNSKRVEEKYEEKYNEEEEKQEKEEEEEEKQTELHLQGGRG